MLRKIELTLRDWLKREERAGRFVPTPDPEKRQAALSSPRQHKRCRI